MQKLPKRRPILAALLALFLGPIGYAYIGGWFMLSGIFIAALFSVVLFILQLPYPQFFDYFQLLIYAHFGYKFIRRRNLIADRWDLTDDDIKEIKSFGFNFAIMTNLLLALARFYCLIVGSYLAFKFFSDGDILIGFFILIFGIGLLIWLLSSVFAFISGLLMLLFKVNKKYFDVLIKNISNDNFE